MEHQLTIYNTLDRKKELFVPLHAPHVGMYVCGPTVYGDAALGTCTPCHHFRPAVPLSDAHRIQSTLCPQHYRRGPSGT